MLFILVLLQLNSWAVDTPEGPRRRTTCEDQLNPEDRDAHFKDWMVDRRDSQRRWVNGEEDVDLDLGDPQVP